MTEFKVRDSRTEKRYFVDNAIIRVYGKALKPAGIAIYNALCLHAGKDTQRCWPSYQTMADLVGMSRKAAIRATQVIVDLKLVRKEAGWTDDGDRSSNIYTLLDPPSPCESLPQSPTVPRVVPVSPPNNPKLTIIKEREEEDIITFDSLKGMPKKSDQYQEENPEAIADPSKQSSAVEEMARQLAPPIDWVWGFSKKTDNKLVHAAQQLLDDCKGDMDGALEALDDYCASDGDWARLNLDDPHGLATLAARRYQKVYARQQSNTTAGRVTKYANYPGVLS